MRTGTSAFGFVSAVIFALASGPASAADVAVKAPSPLLSPVPVANWSGFYVGVNAGATWGYFRNTTGSIGPFDSDGGFSGGGQLGYNIQRGRWVYGVEGDFSLIDVTADTPGTASFRERWTSSVRGRAGYTVENFLAYITLGVAFTQTKAELVATGSSETKTIAGVTGGVGLEMMVAPNWSARVEALYTDVPKHTFNVTGGPIVGGSYNYTVRAGLNYWFH